MLLASAVLRFGLGVADALAREPAQPAATEAAAPPPEAGALLDALRRREARVAQAEAAVAERVAALSLAEAAIDARLDELLAAEAALSAAVARSESAAEDDLARLTAVYESMKPEQAAILFGEMAPEFAAGFLARMRPEAAAGILAGLPPPTAYAISVVLAGRNARAPRE